MDSETAYKATKLFEGDIRKQKDSLKKNVVKGVLPECPDEFTVDDVITASAEEFDTEISKHIVIDSLENFEGEYVKKISEDEYKLISEPEFENLETLLEPSWREYKQLLHLYDDDIDPQRTAELKPLFTTFLQEFFLEISDSIKSLNDYQVRGVYTEYDGTDEIIDEAIDNGHTDQGELFRETIIEYIKDPGEELISFTEQFYQAALNYDILKKDSEIIDFPSIPAKNKKLILDTNVIVLLLAETDNKHMLAKSIVKQSQSEEIGFDVCYLPKTEEEVDNLINGTKYEIENIPLLEDNEDKLNQLTQHFRRETGMSKEEYLRELNNWRSILEEVYNISVLEPKYKSSNQDVNDFVTKELISETSGTFDENLVDRVDHDSTMMGYAARYRDEADLDFGPFVISDHEQITSIGVSVSESEETKDIVGGQPLAIHPQGWLNYILSFASFELGEDAKRNMSMGILTSSLDVEENIELEEYIHTLTPQIGLEFEDEDDLKDYLLGHTLGEELERAIENNEITEARDISTRILDDVGYKEAIQNNFKSKLVNVREKLEEKEEKIEELTSEPEQSTLKDKYRSILYQLDSSYPMEVEEGEIPPPPEEASITEIKQWLNTATAMIQESDPDSIPNDVQELFSDMELLYSECIEYLN